LFSGSGLFVRVNDAYDAPNGTDNSLAKLEELIYYWSAGLQAEQAVRLELLLLKVSIDLLIFYLF